MWSGDKITGLGLLPIIICEHVQVQTWQVRNIATNLKITMISPPCFSHLFSPSRGGRWKEQRVQKNKMSKIELPSMRESNNQGFEGIEKAPKIDVKPSSQACWQKVQKIVPEVTPNGPKSKWRGSKMRSIIYFNLKIKQTWRFLRL